MRGRRALTVRIVAIAGVAATVVGLMTPSPRLWAQKPADGPEPSGSPPPPADKKTDLPDLPPRTEPDANPLPPAIPSEVQPAREATAVAPPTSHTPEGTLADPEGAAKAFVEKSQKEADEAINALSKEAETLRARLQKVEAGLARWQAVKESLEARPTPPIGRRGEAGAGGGTVIPGRVPAPGSRDENPTILEPLPAPSTDEPKARPAVPGPDARNRPSQ